MYATFIVFLNLFVIVLSLSSLLLCLRALLRAQLLKHETMIFMSRHYNWVLTVQERCEFLNLWYVMICTNDCLIIMGSVIKQLIEGTDCILDGVGQLVSIKVELLQLLDLSERVLRGLDVRDQVLLQIKMFEARQPSEDVPLDNLNLISLQVESVHLFAELPAVILDVVHLVVTKT